MGLDVSAALRRGFDRSVTRRGLLLMGALWLLDILFVGIPSAIFDTTGAVSNAFALAVPSLVGVILSMAVAVIAIRMFVEYDPARNIRDYASDQLGFATLNLVVGGIVASVIIGFGFILIIPGVYLLVSLLLWHIIVAVEGEDFVDAFRGSWALTEGHKWRLLLLVIGLGLLFIVVNVLGGLVTIITSNVLLSSIIIGALSAFMMVYGIAVVAEAYNQIRR